MEHPRQGEDSQEGQKTHWDCNPVGSWGQARHWSIATRLGDYSIGGVAMVRRRVTVRTRTVRVPVKVRVKTTTVLKRVRRVR